MSTPRLAIIPGGAATDRNLKPRDLQVLCVLGRHIDDGGWCRRSQVKMAEEIGCARSTVYEAIERLVKRGYLERHLVVSENGRDSAHRYRVVLDPVIEDLSAVHEEETIEANFGQNEPETPLPVYRHPCRYIGTPAGISAPPAGPEPAPPAGPGPAPRLTTPINDPLLTGGVVARAHAREAGQVSDRSQAFEQSCSITRNEQSASQPSDPSPGERLKDRGRRVCEAMGIRLDDPSWRGDLTVLFQWDACGFDFELDVLPVIASVSRGMGQVPGSLSYFTQPIRRAFQRRKDAEAGRLDVGLRPAGQPLGGAGFGGYRDEQAEKIRAALADVFKDESEVA